MTFQQENEIVTLARTSGRVAVDDLASRYDVSPQTIRKDLNELCDRHLLSRVHGGATIASGVENIAYEAMQAAVVKSDGGERCGNGGTRFRQARLREASASKPLMTCRKRIRRCQNPGVAIPSGSAWGMPETAQAASGMEAARSNRRGRTASQLARVVSRGETSHSHPALQSTIQMITIDGSAPVEIEI